MLLLLFVGILLAFLAQWYLLKYGLDRVQFSQHTSASLLEPEQPFTVYTTLQNQKKWLPVLLSVQERLPEDLSILGQAETGRRSLYRVRYYEYCQYLQRNAKVTRSYQASVPARGRYIFRGAVLKGNDFLGVQESTLAVEEILEVVAAPKPMEGMAIDTLLGGFLGDVSVRRYIMEDPTLHTGFRAYTGREAMRAISWSQSAKGQGLLVKQYDYTSEPSIAIVLSVEDGTPAQLEVCYSIVRTLCEQLEKKRVRYDFYTNAVMIGAPRACRHTGEGLGQQHFNTILEGLARATYLSAESLHATLRGVSTRVGSVSTVIVLPEKTACSSAQIQHFHAQTGGALRVITPQEVQG